MSRRLKLATMELGNLELCLVFQQPTGEWEPEWEPLRMTVLADLFTQIPQEVVDHALHGWTSPFVKVLGLCPAHVLHKLPRQCGQRQSCIYHRTECIAISPKRPWCFEPEGMPEEARTTSLEAVRLWGEGVYLVLVT